MIQFARSSDVTYPLKLHNSSINESTSEDCILFCLFTYNQALSLEGEFKPGRNL
jgi:hypothetical protein